MSGYTERVGLREFKKLHTRQQIADEAMRLFATRGFDHVTVGDVAAAAGVSQKTVFNYFPTKEDLFFDEVPKREAAIVEAISGREPGESVLGALRRLQLQECPRLCSPSFASFARIIEESAALQAKELEVMARFAQVLADAMQSELGVDERDARIAAGLLVSVHRQVFRGARKQALAGKHGPAAVRRLRADLERAYELLEHGLGNLEGAARAREVS
ncbi:MAG TPA: TetR family transcriptional regulator [Gaiellaceae bacterium]|nr:TetR family transcriptional regulator [Gaiellaceae bacterium]